MRIDRYDFGHIDIEGRSYDADVIVFPDHVQERWWRQEGHRLAPEDLASVLAEKPEVLIVGTGYYGRLRVPEESLDALRNAGVSVRIEKTGEAVAEFKRMQGEYARIVAALHLTC